MKKIIIITVLLLITTIALAALYFSNLFSDDRNSNKVLSYIPHDSALVLQFTNDNSFYEIFKDYTLFNSIIGKTRKSELHILKSSLLENPRISQLTDQQKIFLSFHQEKDSTEFLWLSMLSDKVDLADLQKGSSNKFKITTDSSLSNGNNHFMQVMIAGLPKPFYMFIDGSVVIGSFSKPLLQRSINKQEPKISETFIKEISDIDIKNTNSLINIYFNLGTFQKYLTGYFKDKKGGNFALLNDVKGLSTLNLNFKSDALMFNGISKPDTSSSNYLTLFLHQNPAKNTLMRVVPQSTSNYLLFGISNYSQFTTDLRKLLKKRNQYDKLAKQIQDIADKNGISPERDIKGLWGNEFITFQLANHEKFAAIKVSNGRQLEFLLEPLSKPATEAIRQINYPEVFYFYFGDPLREFKRPYYFIADNTLFIANSSGALQRFNSQYGADRFLYKTDEFKSFEQLTANESNITLFIHNNNSKSIIKSKLTSGFANAFTNSNYQLKDFYGLSYQWSSDKHHFFTNLYIGYKSEVLQPSALSGTKDSLYSGVSSPSVQ